MKNHVKRGKFNAVRFKKALVCIALAAFGGVLIAFPQRYLSVCFDGLSLWAECVLPSLFPFMVITMLLINLGAAQAASRRFARVSRKMKLPAAALPLFLMSVCSGYPAGSRILCEYRERGLITQSETKKLAPLLSTCGPLFALGTVGGKAFGGNGAGAKLFAACLISVITTSLVYAFFSKDKEDGAPLTDLKKSEGNVLYSCFHGGVTACLVAGGFICFFYTLSQVIADFYVFKPLEAALSLPFKELAAPLCQGLCEATGGCFALAAEGGFFALPLAGFLITFGGISILMQQLSYLGKCGIKTGFFIAFKFMQGVICFALICLFSLF